MKEIEILGTVYQFVVEDEELEQKNLDGVCLCYAKKIQVRPAEKMLGSYDTMEEKQSRYREVVRHELVHAFFFESGLESYSDDEVLVDWLAKMAPKMAELFQEEGCLRC